MKSRKIIKFDYDMWVIHRSGYLVRKDNAPKYFGLSLFIHAALFSFFMFEATRQMQNFGSSDLVEFEVITEPGPAVYNDSFVDGDILSAANIARPLPEPAQLAEPSEPSVSKEVLSEKAADTSKLDEEHALAAKALADARLAQMEQEAQAQEAADAKARIQAFEQEQAEAAAQAAAEARAAKVRAAAIAKAEREGAQRAADAQRAAEAARRAEQAAAYEQQRRNEAESLAAERQARMAPVSGNGALSAGDPQGIRGIGDLRQMPGNPKPNYAPEERLNKHEGEVVFNAFVTPEGTLTDFKLVKSTGFRSLDGKTLSALRKWKFYPNQSGWVRIPFVWTLRGEVQEAGGLLKISAAPQNYQKSLSGLGAPREQRPTILGARPEAATQNAVPPAEVQPTEVENTAEGQTPAQMGSTLSEDTWSE